MVIFHSFLYVYQRVTLTFCREFVNRSRRRCHGPRQPWKLNWTLGTHWETVAEKGVTFQTWKVWHLVMAKKPQHGARAFALGPSFCLTFGQQFRQSRQSRRWVPLFRLQICRRQWLCHVLYIYIYICIYIYTCIKRLVVKDDSSSEVVSCLWFGAGYD